MDYRDQPPFSSGFYTGYVVVYKLQESKSKGSILF